MCCVSARWMMRILTRPMPNGAISKVTSKVFFLFPLQHFTPFRGAYIDLMLIFYPFLLSFGSSCVRVIRRLIAIALILGVVVCLPNPPLSLFLSLPK